MPKVSVVIPVYNSEKYLNQCLDSLRNQTLSDFEAICINDGSTDSSLKILKDFASKDTRFIIINKDNEGQGVARNIAIEKAKGEYLLCLDSDDWLENEALEKAYNKIHSDKTDIMFFDVYKYIQKNEKKYLLKNTEIYKNFNCKPFSSQDAGKILFKTNCLPFKIYRTKFLQDNNIKYSKHKFMEDAPFYIKAMLYANKISCLSSPIYNYRVAESSASFNFKQYFKCIPEVYDICFNIIQDFENIPEILDSFLENREKSLLCFYKTVPLLYKPKYCLMLKNIIKKNFSKYTLSNNLKEIYNLNPFVYIILCGYKKFKYVLFCYTI